MTAKITPNLDSYRRPADKLTDKHTMLRPFFRFCDWSVGAIARHWLGVSGAVVMAGILLGAAFWVAPALWPYWLIVLGLFISSGVLFLCVGYGQHFFSRYAEKQAAELGQQTVGVARLQGDIARLRSEIGSVVSTLRNVCASVDKDPQLKELQERCKTLEAQISAHVDAVRVRQDALDNTIAARVDELERGLASVQAASESADRVLDDVRAQAADALETVRVRQDALDNTIAARVDELERGLASVQAASESADRVLDDVRTQAADALEMVRNSQATLDTMMAAQVEEITRSLTASADGVLDDVRAQAAAIKTLAAEAVDAVRSQDAAFRKLNASNASLARPFNRFLSTDHIRRLQQHWSKVFGVTMSPSAISYLAHRMCTAEDQCEGRIACSIETAILRQYALRSLKGDRIEVLEIGTLFGLGAAFLYKFAVPDQSGIRLTLIDPLEGYYGNNVLDPITGVPVDRRTLESNFEVLKIPSKDWRLIQRLSTDPVAAQEAADWQYDLILIDGDHSVAGVTRDYEIYGSMVKPGWARHL
ncbi:MAG: hypothetical protein M5R38_16220 [Candidatus Methylomirabilis sp.]|nr:hypothetical protein [Candidatus Methylomirabilis sp.]